MPSSQPAWLNNETYTNKIQLRLATITVPAIASAIVLRLIDSEHAPLRVANVLFIVHTFANRKNDFKLGPFATDAEGVVTKS